MHPFTPQIEVGRQHLTKFKPDFGVSQRGGRLSVHLSNSFVFTHFLHVPFPILSFLIGSVTLMHLKLTNIRLNDFWAFTFYQSQFTIFFHISSFLMTRNSLHLIKISQRSEICTLKVAFRCKGIIWSQSDHSISANYAISK